MGGWSSRKERGVRREQRLRDMLSRDVNVMLASLGERSACLTLMLCSLQASGRDRFLFH